MRARLIFDSQRYTSKPSKAETGKIQERLKNNPAEDAEISVIAERLASGYSVRANDALTQKDSRGNDIIVFLSQSLFCVDIDNGDKEKGRFIVSERVLEPDDAIKIAIRHGLYPAFAYKTFSDRKAEYSYVPRFWLAFVSDRPITNENERSRIERYICDIFQDSKDNNAMGCNRLFYGGKGLIYEDYDRTFNADEILSKAYNNISTSAKPIKTPKAHKMLPRKDVELTAAVTAIQNHDAQYFRDRLGYPRKLLETTQELWDYIYSVPLTDFLGIGEKERIRCIFSDHEDSRPSANVFMDDRNGKEVWLYKCFSHSGKQCYNIRQLCEKIGDFKTPYHALEFVKQALNCDVELTEFQKEYIASLEMQTDMLDLGEFAEQCPSADKVTAYCKDVLRTLIAIAKTNVFANYKTKDGEPIFYATHKQIIRQCGRSITSSKQEAKMTIYLQILAYCGIIRKLSDSEIPPKPLSKARSIVAKGAKDGEKRTRHAEFYCIRPWVIQNLETIEKYGQDYLAHRYKTKGFGVEVVMRTEGIEAAKRISPQVVVPKVETRREIISQKANDRDYTVQEIINELLDSQGYFREAEAIQRAREVLGSYSGEMQVKRSLPNICQQYGIARVRATKARKEELGITAKGYPVIYIR